MGVKVAWCAGIHPHPNPPPSRGRGLYITLPALYGGRGLYITLPALYEGRELYIPLSALYGGRELYITLPALYEGRELYIPLSALYEGKGVLRQGNRVIVTVILSEGEESRETLNNVIPVKTGISTRGWRSASGGRLRGNDGLSPNYNAIALGFTQGNGVLIGPSYNPFPVPGRYLPQRRRLRRGSQRYSVYSASLRLEESSKCDCPGFLPIG